MGVQSARFDENLSFRHSKTGAVTPLFGLHTVQLSTPVENWLFRNFDELMGPAQ